MAAKSKSDGRPARQGVELQEVWAIEEWLDPLGAKMPPYDSPFLLSTVWVKRHNLDPATLRFFQQYDDSMAPRIKRGDIVVIDIADNLVESQRIYLVQHPYGARLRRLFNSITNRVLLSPDNADPSYRMEPVEAQDRPRLRVVGRVIFALTFP